jgi:predicted metal-dependent RNase
MKRSKGDVMYTVPNKKKPIAYSTVATQDLIVILAQDYETISDVYNAINYDQDAKDVLKKYIDLGYGNVIAREWFR